MSTERVFRVWKETSLRILASIFAGKIWERRLVNSALGVCGVLLTPTVVGGHDEAGQLSRSGKPAWRDMRTAAELGDVRGTAWHRPATSRTKLTQFDIFMLAIEKHKTRRAFVTSGSVCISLSILHAAAPDLPFLI